jgi:hypothetical protein
MKKLKGLIKGKSDKKEEEPAKLTPALEKMMGKPKG